MKDGLGAFVAVVVVNPPPDRAFPHRREVSMSAMRSATGKNRLMMRNSSFLFAGILLALTACGSGGDSSGTATGTTGGTGPGTGGTTPPPPVTLSATDAQRLLEQATF